MVAAVASYFSKINIILWGGEREDAIFSFPFKTYFFNKDFFENNEKKGATCDEKSQISPLKRQGKGSLLLPCSKIPFGIFLFTNKSEFQKSEETGKKRRKPEKISVFSFGIFFVKTLWRRHPESHSATGTVSVANRILLPAAAEPSPMEGCVNPKRKTSPLDWFSFWRRHPESDRG